MGAKKPTKILRWSREPNERGLASVGQGERGWNLKLNGKVSGYVRPRYQGWGRIRVGYFGVSRDDAEGIALLNTAGTPVPTIDAAMDEVETHIAKALSDRFSVRFNRSAYERKKAVAP